MRELFNVRSEFVSFVSAGANRKKFKIFKSANFKEGKIGGRYEKLAEKFYKESFIKNFKEHMKDWFGGLRKTQEEIDKEEKGGGTMNKEAEEKKLEEKRKAKEEEDRIKAEKEAKEQEEKAEKEALKVKVAEAVEAILLNKEKREELKVLIEKVEKGEKIEPEEMTKLKEALDMKPEEKSSEEKLKKDVEILKAKIEVLERGGGQGTKKSIPGQDGGQGEKKWPSLSG